MKRKIFETWFLFVAMATVMVSCDNKTKGIFTVTVTYRNADKRVIPNSGDSNQAIMLSGSSHILLEEIPYGGDMRPVLLDSGTIKGKNGKIVLKGNGTEESIYQIVIENGPLVLLINDVQKIDVDIDLSKKDNYYTVNGSEASQHLKDFITHYDEKAAVINKAFAEIDSLKQFGGSDASLIAATNRKNQAISSLNDYLRDFMEKADSPAESIFALGICSRSFQRDEFEKMLNSVVKRFPEHKALLQLKTTYDLQQAQLSEMNKKKQENSWVGKQVPDIILPSPDGKPVSVASFRGKYLLIDFWASWCGPCRQENPNVVRVYNEFKNKNFTILGVSLDKEKDSWLKAINDDQLTWMHVSDLRMWSSKAVDVFKFDGIPYNVLVNPKGQVIGESLRGAELESKLKEVLQ